jgi:LruC domain-containing protein
MRLKLVTRIFSLAITALSALPATALELDTNGRIIWSYFDGTPTGDKGALLQSYQSGGGIPANHPNYAPNFNTSAKPLTAPATLNTLTSKINFTLPEKRHIDKASFVLSEDDQTNIHIQPGQDADVWVTFLSEGAGYENSVGFFTYPLNAVPTRNANGTNTLRSEQIFFPRASASYPLPTAGPTGTTVHLGRFNGGTAGLGIGFMVISNGWSATGRNGQPGVKSQQDRNWIFYSLKGLNPECQGQPATCKLDQHTALLNDGQVVGSDGVAYRRMVVGFEDMNRTNAGSDHDFNDVLMAIHVTPEQSISNLSKLPGLLSSTDPDTDGDGVKDSVDEYPQDPAKTYSRFYPGSNTWGTLAFEDRWPLQGDYDLNDIVVRYRSKEILNAARKVTALEMDLRLDARGGGHRNGFAVGLPSVQATQIKSWSLTRQGQNVQGALKAQVTVEGGGVVFDILDDATLLMPDDNSDACQVKGYRNTGKGCPIRDFQSFSLKLELVNPADNFPLPPYNPFLFRTDGAAAKGIEVHLPGRQPSSRADARFFGTGDDRSVLGTAQTYKNANGLPWALELPTEWAHPQEFLDTVTVYPRIVPWAESGGTTDRNWYDLSPDRAGRTFTFGR